MSKATLWCVSFASNRMKNWTCALLEIKTGFSFARIFQLEQGFGKIQGTSTFWVSQAAMEFQISIPNSCGNIIQISNDAAKKLWRFCLLKIIECLQYLARQAMPMQGDTDKDSNFTQLLKLRGKDQPVLLKWLARKEDKYTSHEIQNQIISIMAKYCLPQFSSRYLWWIFALIADECTDISNNMYPMDLINT